MALALGDGTAGAPLSVVIPTLDAGAALPDTLGALASGRHLVREIIVADGGSCDDTIAAAQRGGAQVIAAPRGRGTQLATGAASAAGEWLLFLHADTRLGDGWERAVETFIAGAGDAARAGYFRYRLDDTAAAARVLEAAVAWRCRVLALPYGDQGLLDRAPALSRGRRLPASAADGGRRSRAPAGAGAARLSRCRGRDFGGTLSPRRLCAARAAQCRVPCALPCRRAAPRHSATLWLSACGSGVMSSSFCARRNSAG